MKTKLKYFSGVILFSSLIFLVGHTAWADPPWGCDVELSGILCDIISANGDHPCAIVISQDGSCNAETNVTVYGISTYHLAQRYNLNLYDCMEQGLKIHVWAHACPIDAEQERYRACTISAEDGDEINLLPPAPKYQQWKNQNRETNQEQNEDGCREGGKQKCKD